MHNVPCATEIRALAAHLFFAQFNSSLPSSSSLLYVTCTRYAYSFLFMCFFWLFYFWLFRHYGQNSVYVCVATAAVGSHSAIIIIIIIFVTIGWLADCIQLYVVDSVHFWVSCIHSSVRLFIYVFFHCRPNVHEETCNLLFAFNFAVASTQPNNKWFPTFACSWFFGTFGTIRSVDPQNSAVIMIKWSEYSYCEYI